MFLNFYVLALFNHLAVGETTLEIEENLRKTVYLYQWTFKILELYATSSTIWSWIWFVSVGLRAHYPNIDSVAKIGDL